MREDLTLSCDCDGEWRSLGPPVGRASLISEKTERKQSEVTFELRCVRASAGCPNWKEPRNREKNRRSPEKEPREGTERRNRKKEPKEGTQNEKITNKNMHVLFLELSLIDNDGSDRRN